MKITIQTWPFQWLYWPMYRALHEVQSRYEIEIEMLAVPNATDRAIRTTVNEAWAKAKSDSPLVLALGEPDAMDEDACDIPLVWRMPHFLVGQQKPNAGEKVLAYGSETTSGKFARARLGPARVDDDQPLQLSNYLSEPNGRSAFHFAPLEGLSGLKLFEEHSGPTRVVSALSFPPRGSTADVPTVVTERKDVVQRAISLSQTNRQKIEGRSIPLFQAILNALNRTLWQLEDTHGQSREVQVLLNTYPLDHLIRPNNADIPQWLMESVNDPERPGVTALALLLARYVRRGCYFPYEAVERATRAFVEMAVESQLRRALREEPRQVRQELTRILGEADSWAGLSFAERRQASLHWSKSGIKGSADEQLWSAITHGEPPRENEPVELFLNQFRIAIPNRGEYFLREFHDGIRPSVHGWERKNKFWESKFRCQPGSAIVRDGACFVCHLCGFLDGLAADGCQLLDEELRKRHGANYKLTGHLHGQDRVGTSHCWDDVRPVFDVFAKEIRGKNDDKITAQNEPHCRVLWVADQDARKTLLAILWQGCTKPHANSGRGARQQLSNWAEAESQAGRSPAAVWLWWRVKPEHVPVDSGGWLEVWQRGEFGKTNHDVRDSLWCHENYKCDFACNEFDFAYVVLYDLDA